MDKANEFKRLYLNDILSAVNEAAIQVMIDPPRMFMGDQASKVESLEHLNDRIAHYNSGARAMAVFLTNKLTKEAETDDA